MDLFDYHPRALQHHLLSHRRDTWERGAFILADSPSELPHFVKDVVLEMERDVMRGVPLTRVWLYYFANMCHILNDLLDRAEKESGLKNNRIFVELIGFARMDLYHFEHNLPDALSSGHFDVDSLDTDLIL